MKRYIAYNPYLQTNKKCYITDTVNIHSGQVCQHRGKKSNVHSPRNLKIHLILLTDLVHFCLDCLLIFWNMVIIRYNSNQYFPSRPICCNSRDGLACNPCMPLIALEPPITYNCTKILTTAIFLQYISQQIETYSSCYKNTLFRAARFFFVLRFEASCNITSYNHRRESRYFYHFRLFHPSFQ